MKSKRPKTRRRENERDEKELISSLTREQQKQWKGYGRHDQERILKRIDRRVKKRMRFRFQEKEEKKGGKQRSRDQKAGEEVLRGKKKENAYDRALTFQKRESTSGAFSKTGSKVKELKTGFKDKPAAGSNKKKEDLLGKQKEQNRPFQGETAKLDTGDKKDKDPDKKAREETNPAAFGYRPYKSRQRKGPKISPSAEETVFDGKFRYEEEKRTKDFDEGKKAKKKLFMREFTAFLFEEEKRNENRNREILMEEVSLSQKEQEMKGDTIRIISYPLQRKAAKLKREAAEKITAVLAGVLKYLAGFGGILLVLLFFLLFFFALFAAITEREQGNAPCYSASGEEIVAYAKEWIGVTKYIYGAGRASPTDWQDYADCSSFVHGVFNHFGIELGGDTYAMEQNGTVIEGGLSAALPGDLILFYSGSISPGNSSHVGIYAGEGMMVHCSGGKANVSPATAGRGVCMGSVNLDGRPYEVRRIVSDVQSGYRTDPTRYTNTELELIWAIVCQEDGGSYAGALAVISTAMNRVDSPAWSSLGNNAYLQLTAPGQFCYSIDSYWKKYLGGNVPDFVKQAVSDCLDRGIRNHTHTSFRSYYTQGSEQIGGGNYYFG